MGQLSFAMYKPKKGKATELKNILKEHIPTLRKYELISKKDAYMIQSSDGTIIEVFEWASESAKDAAHKHPAIMKIWGPMMPICEFPTMKDLPESAKSFPNFEVIQ